VVLIDERRSVDDARHRYRAPATLARGDSRTLARPIAAVRRRAWSPALDERDGGSVEHDPGGVDVSLIEPGADPGAARLALGGDAARAVSPWRAVLDIRQYRSLAIA
jgi:hypothetical protein